MFSSVADTEEDHFRQRLDEINKEMQSLIERTATEGAHILRFPPAPPAPSLSVSHADPHPAAGAPLPSRAAPAALPAAGALDESSVRRIVAEEARELRAACQQMVSEAMAGVRAALGERLDDMRQSQSGLADALAAEAAKLPLRSRAVESMAREADAQARGTVAEVTQLRDAVAALQNSARVDEQRGDRRVDELVRRHHELVRNSLLELDARAAGLRDEFSLMLRAQSRQAAEERDAVRQEVARLHGTLDATSEVAARCAAELRELMEDNAAQRSELRACRRDMNRLEMILRGEPVRGAGEVPAAARGDLPCGTTLQDLQERVGFLAGRADATERQVAGMQRTLQTMTSNTLEAAQGTAKGNNQARHYPLRASSHAATTALQQQQQQQQQQQGSMSGTVSEAPFGSLEIPSLTSHAGSLPLPQSYLNRQQHQDYEQRQQQQQQQQKQQERKSGEEGMKQNMQVEQKIQQHSPQEQPSKKGGGKWWKQNDIAWSSSQGSLRQSSRLSSPEHQGPFRAQQQYQMREQVEESRGPRTHDLQREALPHHQESQAMLDVTVLSAAPKMIPTPSTDPPLKSPEPSDPNSYISNTDTEREDYDGASRKINDNASRSAGTEKHGRSRQYIPAPTSDVESELANAKMARLALD